MIIRFSCLVCIIFQLTLHAQDYNWSLHLNFPIPVDQNFIGENYKGFIDVGTRYTFDSPNNLKFGAAFNFAVLSNNNNLDISQLDSYKAIAYIVETKAFAEVQIPSVPLLHPFFGVGYSLLAFDISGVNPGLGIIEDGEVLHGFSINGGFLIDCNSRLFFNLEYNFIRVYRDNLVPDTRYNKNVNLVKLGVGYRI